MSPVGSPAGNPPKRCVVVTTIHPPTAPLRALATGCKAHGIDLVVVGDRRSPPHYRLPHARYFDLAAQRDAARRLADDLPVGTYARKNVGYLIAIRSGAEIIVETDDDNIPQAGFWSAPRLDHRVPINTRRGWVNVYRYFTAMTRPPWPRGLPWAEVDRLMPEFADLPLRQVRCPIQQGLADDDPDVDAAWRMAGMARVRFARRRHVALARGSWCPFNSQNTRWFPAAFALMFLPSTCNSRLTDIWRGLVAQRILWENGAHLLVHGATMRHARNRHDLLHDFAAEIPAYVWNAEIRRRLDALSLRGGAARIGDDMLRCYEVLVGLRLLDALDLQRLTTWLRELPASSDKMPQCPPSTSGRRLPK